MRYLTQHWRGGQPPLVSGSHLEIASRRRQHEWDDCDANRGVHVNEATQGQQRVVEHAKSGVN